MRSAADKTLSYNTISGAYPFQILVDAAPIVMPLPEVVKLTVFDVLVKIDVAFLLIPQVPAPE